MKINKLEWKYNKRTFKVNIVKLIVKDIYYAKYYGKGGNGQLGKKLKLGAREKNEKGERK